jgi:hypothetical protein
MAFLDESGLSYLISKLVGRKGVNVNNDNIEVPTAEKFNDVNNVASAEYSHAEGHLTTANGFAAHAEGVSSAASYQGAHAEGIQCRADANASHAEGAGTRAIGDAQHVQGRYNAPLASYIHIIGNADSGKLTDRKNIHTVDYAGNANYAGKVTVGRTTRLNADGTELIVNEDITQSITDDGDLTTKKYVDSKVAAIGTVHCGTTAPTSDIGKSGDLYIQYIVSAS